MATFQPYQQIQFTLIYKTINKAVSEEVEKTSSFYAKVFY